MRFKFFPLAKTLDLFWSLQAAPHSIHHTLVYNILEHKGAFVLSRTKSHTVHNPAEITAILAMRQAKSKTTAVFECQTIFVFFFSPNALYCLLYFTHSRHTSLDFPYIRYFTPEQLRQSRSAFDVRSVSSCSRFLCSYS